MGFPRRMSRRVAAAGPGGYWGREPVETSAVLAIKPSQGLAPPPHNRHMLPAGASGTASRLLPR